jgi:thiamine phosphate synthase YjbQ (UPF0047 family)
LFNVPQNPALQRVAIERISPTPSSGRLDVGPWEQIFYGEFDGKRRKRALIKIIGE